MLNISKINHRQSIQRPKISLIINFHVSTTFASLVINLIFWATGNDDVMLGFKILKTLKIHHHQSIQRPKISRDARFYDSTTFGYLVNKFLKL